MGIIIDARVDSAQAERDLASLNRQMRELADATKVSGIALQQSLKQDFSGLTKSIQSSVSGLVKFQQQGNAANESVARSTNKTADAMSNLKAIVLSTGAAFAAFQGVKAFGQMSDDLTNIQNRLKLVNDDFTSMTATQTALKKVAFETRSALSDVAGLYTDFSLALAKSGKSEKQIIGVIKTIQQAGALSGSSQESLRAGIVQLTQGIASGTIRGEELNSVLEQMKYLSTGIQREMNMNTGSLRAFAEAGSFTTEVFLNTVGKLSESTAKDFAKTSATIEQGAYQLKESISYVVGSLSQSYGIGVSFANMLLRMAEGVSKLGSELEFMDSYLELFQDSMKSLYGNLKGKIKLFDEADIIKSVDPLVEKISKTLANAFTINTTHATFSGFSYSLIGSVEYAVNRVMTLLRGLGSSNLTEMIIPVDNLFDLPFEKAQTKILKLQNSLSTKVYDLLVNDTRRGIDTILSVFTSAGTLLEYYSPAGILDRLSLKQSGEIFAERIVLSFEIAVHKIDLLFTDLWAGIFGRSSLELATNIFVTLAKITTYLDGFITSFVTNFKKLDVVKTFINSLGSAIEVVTVFLKESLSYLENVFSESNGYALGKSLGEAIVKGLGTIKVAIVSIFDGTATANTFVASVISVFTVLAKFLLSFLKGLYDGVGVSNAVGNMLKSVESLISANFLKIKTNVAQLLTTVAENASMLIEKLKNKLSALLSEASAYKNISFNFIVDKLPTINIASIFEKSLDKAEKVYLAFVKAISDKMGTLTSAISIDINSSDLQKMYQKIFDVTRAGLSTTLEYIKVFGEKVKEIFFKVYDAVVGHSYWPDMIDGVVAYAKNLSGAESYIRSFADKVNDIFANISGKISASIDFSGFDIVKNMGGMLVAALSFAFGSPAAKAAAWAYFTGAFGGANLSLMDSLAKGLGISFGGAIENFTENVVSGILSLSDVIISLAPAIMEGLIRGVTGWSSLEFDAATLIGPLASFTNSITSTILLLSVAIMLFSENARKATANFLIGSKRSKAEGGGRNSGFLDYVGATQLFGNLTAPLKGSFNGIIKDSKAALVGIGLLSTAYLDSVSIFEAAALAIPALLYSVLGKEVMNKAFNDAFSYVFSSIGNMGKKMLSYFTPIEAAVKKATPTNSKFSSLKEKFTKNRDETTDAFLKGEASFSQLFLGIPTKKSKYEGMNLYGTSSASRNNTSQGLYSPLRSTSPFNYTSATRDAVYGGVQQLAEAQQRFAKYWKESAGLLPFVAKDTASIKDSYSVLKKTVKDNTITTSFNPMPYSSKVIHSSSALSEKAISEGFYKSFSSIVLGTMPESLQKIGSTSSPLVPLIKGYQQKLVKDLYGQQVTIFNNEFLSAVQKINLGSTKFTASAADSASISNNAFNALNQHYKINSSVDSTPIEKVKGSLSEDLSMLASRTKALGNTILSSAQRFTGIDLSSTFSKVSDAISSVLDSLLSNMRSKISSNNFDTSTTGAKSKVKEGFGKDIGAAFAAGIRKLIPFEGIAQGIIDGLSSFSDTAVSTLDFLTGGVGEALSMILRVVSLGTLGIKETETKSSTAADKLKTDAKGSIGSFFDRMRTFFTTGILSPLTSAIIGFGETIASYAGGIAGNLLPYVKKAGTLLATGLKLAAGAVIGTVVTAGIQTYFANSQSLDYLTFGEKLTLGFNNILGMFGISVDSAVEFKSEMMKKLYATKDFAVRMQSMPLEYKDVKIGSTLDTMVAASKVDESKLTKGQQKGITKFIDNFTEISDELENMRLEGLTPALSDIAKYNDALVKLNTSMAKLPQKEVETYAEKVKRSDEEARLSEKDSTGDLVKRMIGLETMSQKLARAGASVFEGAADISNNISSKYDIMFQTVNTFTGVWFTEISKSITDAYSDMVERLRGTYGKKNSAQFNADKISQDVAETKMLPYVNSLSKEDQTKLSNLKDKLDEATHKYSYADKLGNDTTDKELRRQADDAKLQRSNALKDYLSFIAEKAPVAYVNHLSEELKSGIEGIKRDSKAFLGIEVDTSGLALSKGDITVYQSILKAAGGLDNELKNGLLTDTKRNSLLQQQFELRKQLEALIASSKEGAQLATYVSYLSKLSGIDTEQLTVRLSTRPYSRESTDAAKRLASAKAAAESLPVGAGVAEKSRVYNEVKAAEFALKSTLKLSNSYLDLSKYAKDAGLAQLDLSSYTSMTSKQQDGLTASLEEYRLAQAKVDYLSAKIAKNPTNVEELNTARDEAVRDAAAKKSAASAQIASAQLLQLGSVSENTSGYITLLAEGFTGLNTNLLQSSSVIPSYIVSLKEMASAQVVLDTLLANNTGTAEYAKDVAKAAETLDFAKASVEGFNNIAKVSMESLSSYTGGLSVNILSRLTNTDLLDLKALKQQADVIQNKLSLAITGGSLDGIRRAVTEKTINLIEDGKIAAKAVMESIHSVIAGGEDGDLLLALGIDFFKSEQNIKDAISDLQLRITAENDPIMIEALLSDLNWDKQTKKMQEEQKAFERSIGKSATATPSEQVSAALRGVDASASALSPKFTQQQMALQARKDALEANKIAGMSSEAYAKQNGEIARSEELLQESISSAKEYYNVHRKASDVLASFERFSMSAGEITKLPTGLYDEIVGLDSEMVNLNIAMKSAGANALPALQAKMYGLKLKEIDLKFKIDSGSISKSIEYINSVLGSNFDMFDMSRLGNSLSGTLMFIAKDVSDTMTQAIVNGGLTEALATKIEAMKFNVTRLKNFSDALKDATFIGIYAGIDAVKDKLAKVLGIDISRRDAAKASDTDIANVNAMDVVDKTAASGRVSAEMNAVFENLNTDNLKSAGEDLKYELTSMIEGFTDGSKRLSVTAVDNIEKVNSELARIKFVDVIKDASISKVADKAGFGNTEDVARDPSGKGLAMMRQGAILKDQINAQLASATPDMDKLAGLQEAYESLKHSTEDYLSGIRFSADFARQSSILMLSDFKNKLSEGLKGLLRGENSLSDVGTMLLDSLTGSIINTFVEAFLDPLTGENGVISVGLKSFGSWIAGTLQSIFANMQISQASSAAASSSFDWFGAALSLGGSYMSAGSAIDMTGGGSGTFGNAIVSGSDNAMMDKLYGAGNFKRFATGGRVVGGGTGTSDSIAAMISNGEYIINAEATKANLGLLDAINYGKLPKFATGGLVSTTSINPQVRTMEIPTGTSSSASSSQVFNINVTGDISRQTKTEIIQMLPQIAMGVNSHNKEVNYRR